MEFDLKKLEKELNGVLEENKKLQYIKGQYKEMYTRLIAVSEELKKIAVDLDPIAGFKEKGIRKKLDKQIIEDLIVILSK